MGKIIASLRERKALSQAALAQEVGLTQPTLSRVERGQAQIDLFTFSRIAAVFGMSGSELMGRVELTLARTQQAAQGVAPVQQPDQPWWQSALSAGGLSGLGGLVAFAVGAALEERAKKDDE